MTESVTPAFSAAISASEDRLPVWNFANFYPEAGSPEFEADFRKLERLSAAFCARYEGRVAELSGEELAEALNVNLAKDDLEGKLGTYVYLKKTQDSKKYTAAAEAFSNRAAPLYAAEAFFWHEIKQLDEQKIQKMLKESEALRVWEPALRRARQFAPHTPELSVTKYSAELSPSSGVVGLYDKWHAAKRYEFEGQQLNQTELLDIVTEDHDRARRAAAYAVFLAGLKQDSLLMAHLFNERLRLKNVDDKWHKYAQPWESRHMGNNVTTAMADALEQAVRGGYEPVMQRFYRLKAQAMGLAQLETYDRNNNPFRAPDTKYIPFAQAQDTVLEAYRRFSPRMADIAQRFFDEGWIDAVVTKNKESGAYAHPGAARLAQPMVMLNYQGSPSDVATMAHELGHGVHQYLAAFKGDAIVHSPTTFAETASVFGEMLVFRAQLAVAASDDERRFMLCEKINSMINTVFRQIAFHDFEKRCHTAFKTLSRPLTEEEIAQHFADSQRESYGDTIRLPEDFGYSYSYISHFMHSPFYVYGYAFGDALVNALYQVYEEGGVPDFEDKYIAMLEKGGTLEAQDLKSMFGLDIADPAFWSKGLAVIEGLLGDLEKLCPAPAAKPAAAPKPPGL